MTTAAELGRLNLSKLTAGGAKQSPQLQSIMNRAAAAMSAYTPITPEDRLGWFKKSGFHPHGLYWPDHVEMVEQLEDALRKIGDIADLDRRISLYIELQEYTETLEQQGVPGKWRGQQAITRSKARFRIAEIGRRFGKSREAAEEGYGAAVYRPGTVIWIVAPTMKATSRVFDMILKAIDKNQIRCVIKRNTAEEKLIVLENGSKIEAISVEKPVSSLGEAVDLAITDEGAAISKDEWITWILPPLADKNGIGLVLSSSDEEGAAYSDLVDFARKDPEWEVFNEPSWNNPYAFPKGRESASLIHDERIMDASEFNRIYGGIRSAARGRIYPQFREMIHVGYFPFEMDYPVKLSIDPSNGANAYAVAALQDYGATIEVCWEYYVKGVTAEDIIPLVKDMPWFELVDDGVIDSARPDEVERWINAGVPVIPVDKPKIEDRIPIYRRLLRNPDKFAEVRMQIAAEILDRWGVGFENYHKLAPREMSRLDSEIEEALSDQNITPDLVQALRDCAHIFFDRSCVFAIEEHKRYHYARQRVRDLGFKEVPVKADDHMLDLLGYYAWMHKRWPHQLVDPPGVPRHVRHAAHLENRDLRYITEREREILERALAEERDGPRERKYSFLAEMRERHSPEVRHQRSYLEERVW